MKNSRRNIDPDLENIMPHLIEAWRRFHKEPGPTDRLQTREFRGVVSSIQKLIDDKSLRGQDYFADSKLLGAYLLYKWVIHYLQGLSLLGELPEVPKRVLDVCSGPGAFAFAALRHGARQVFATDRSLTALELGAEVCGRYGLPVSIRQWNCLKKSLPLDGNFDLIIVAHSLDELFPADEAGWTERQQQFISKLLERLTPQGHLLIVDNSFPEGNQRVLRLRDQFVNSGVPVQAPCIWQGSCPAVNTPKSPCYAQREFEKPPFIKEVQRAAQINLGSLKMSYVIFKSPQAQWPSVPENKNLYRIISPPIETIHGSRYYLCGTGGKKTLESHLVEHPKESRAFEFLRRGELISIEGALEKGNAFDIIKDTKITVEAPCGKPVIFNTEEQEHGEI